MITPGDVATLLPSAPPAFAARWNMLQRLIDEQLAYQGWAASNEAGAEQAQARGNGR